MNYFLLRFGGSPYSDSLSRLFECSIRAHHWNLYLPFFSNKIPQSVNGFVSNPTPLWILPQEGGLSAANNHCTLQTPSESVSRLCLVVTIEPSNQPSHLTKLHILSVSLAEGRVNGERDLLNLYCHLCERLQKRTNFLVRPSVVSWRKHKVDWAKPLLCLRASKTPPPLS